MKETLICKLGKHYIYFLTNNNYYIIKIVQERKLFEINFNVEIKNIGGV